MVRKLTFTAEDAERFKLLYLGFVIGGNVTNKTGQRSRDERAKEAKILRAFKAISVEEGEARALAVNGHAMVMDLDQKQHDLLSKYLEAAPFPTQQSDDVDDLIDWLESAPRLTRDSE